MKLKAIAGTAEVELGHDELLVLNAALNEVCNGIELFEFETRMGASRTKVESLMASIQEVLDLIENHPR